VPFTEGGFSGVVPEGWGKTARGAYSPYGSDPDATFLAQQLVPGATIDQVKAELLSFLGKDEFPEKVGTVSTGNFTWYLYTTELRGPDAGPMVADLALAQADAWVHLVLLQATPEEYAGLHQAVFLPAVDAFAPASAEVEAVGESAYVYQVPEELGDGWRTSSLDAAGIDTKMITLLTNQIMNGQYRGIRGMLIVKNGALVHEVYFERFNRRDTLNALYSVTKSVTSALIGIAIEEGFIDGVDVTLPSLLPEYADRMGDEGKHDITLEHLLTMTSGLEWDEWTHPYANPKNSSFYLFRATDWMAYVISKPLMDTPGTQFVYNTGAVHLLSAVIKQTTGQHADQFARKHLFGPLDIGSYSWPSDPQGYTNTGGSFGGLSLRARDLAKFGYLFLNRGRWNGKQVVPEAWVESSTLPRVDLDAGSLVSYGYLWWVGTYTIKGHELDYIEARGLGGQLISLVPELDLMVVFTCWAGPEDADIGVPLMTIYQAAWP